MSVELIDNPHTNANQGKSHIIIAIPSEAGQPKQYNEYTIEIAYQMQIFVVYLEGVHNSVTK